MCDEYVCESCKNVKQMCMGEGSAGGVGAGVGVEAGVGAGVGAGVEAGVGAGSVAGYWVPETSPPGGRMFFQVLFAKTCSMKFAKRLEDRWIFASSGTVPFWVPGSTSPVRNLFLEAFLQKTFGSKISNSV